MVSSIIVEQREGIATVTFNRPDVRNAIDYQGWMELRRIADVLAQENSVRVVVFTGKGDDAFSAGADVRDFEGHRENSTQARGYAAAFEGAVNAIEALPRPTICSIKGFCVGGGCELSLGTDIRIAADNGRFGIPAARLGILIGYQEMRRLVNLVGPGDASYLLLSGRLIDAHEALRIGLVNDVVPLSEIDTYTRELAQEVALLAPLSHSRHKRVLQTVLSDPSLKKLTPEDEALPFANFDSADYEEGRRAFMERRAPRFKGE